jgi:hypothetical protein
MGTSIPHALTASVAGVDVFPTRPVPNFTAKVKGEAAVELVAAELHARLDDMMMMAVHARGILESSSC